MARVDIHNMARRYTSAEQRFFTSPTTEQNKVLVRGYRDACLLHQVCGKTRLIRVYFTLLQCTRILPKNFDQYTRADVETLVATFQQQELSPATIATNKAVIKRFLGWVFARDQFPTIRPVPECVAWMTVHLRRRDQKRIQRADLFTPEEIAAILRVCHNARDRAIIATLWESGGRISEVGNPQIKHVTKHPHGFVIDMTGKTGQRTPLLVSSAPHLAAWLAQHPHADDPESPLWISYHGDQPRPVMYQAIYQGLKRYVLKAGIKKRVHPHIFRHSRTTTLLRTGTMTEAQAKQYLGWSPFSNILAVYSHLVTADTDHAILRENNLVPAAEPGEAVLRPKLCHPCGASNPASAEYCTKCTAALDPTKAYQAHQETTQTHQALLRLLRVLVEKDLMNEATTAVNQAGLGPTLKRLAQHHND